MPESEASHGRLYRVNERVFARMLRLYEITLRLGSTAPAIHAAGDADDDLRQYVTST